MLPRPKTQVPPTPQLSETVNRTPRTLLPSKKKKIDAAFVEKTSRSHLKVGVTKECLVYSAYAEHH